MENENTNQFEQKLSEWNSDNIGFLHHFENEGDLQ